jgi:carbon-monoxide dehydrogenase medium subunit
MLARPGLPSFDYVRAESREHVARLLQSGGSDVRLLMGGTDLLVRMRDGVVQAKTLVDVKHVPGMREIAFDSRGGLTVGAAVAMNELAAHPDVQAHYSLLAQAASAVATYQVRNRATLGGNLCNASPAADTAPAVLLLDGRLVLFGPAGEREVPAADFFLGPGKSARRPDEFLTAVRLPVSPEGACGTYLKLGRNKAGDLAVVGVAVLGHRSQDVPSGYVFSIALASVAPVPLRAAAAERLLAEQKPGTTVFAAAAMKAMDAAMPIDDVRSSAAYRKAMVRNLTRQGLNEVWVQLQSES